MLSRAAAALLVTLLAASSAAQTGSPVPDLGTRPDGVDWPRFLGPTGDSRSSEGPLPTSWQAGGPPLVWQREVGDGYSMPTVSRGRLFHFDRVGNRARLTAMNSETGEVLWTSEYPTDYEDYYQYSTGPRASPTVDGDRVYIFGVEGRLRCHRVTDGRLLWERDTTLEFGVVKNFFGVGSTPVVEGPLLIAQIGGSPPGSPKIHSGEVRGNGSGIVAFDKLTGEVRYQLTDELASYASPKLATIDGRRWGFMFTRGGLVGFEPGTGKQDFFFPWRSKVLESVNASTPVVVDDTVFISETYGPGSALLEVRPGGYEVVWKDPPGRGQSLQTHWNTPVHHDGHLYASSGRNSGNAELRAVDHATGEVRWSRPGLKRATLLWVDDHFLVLGEYGELRLVRANPERYEEVAMVDLSAIRVGAGNGKPLISYPAWNAPILSHGLLYVLGKGRLAAFELIAQEPNAAAAVPGR